MDLPSASSKPDEGWMIRFDDIRLDSPNQVPVFCSWQRDGDRSCASVETLRKTIRDPV